MKSHFNLLLSFFVFVFLFSPLRAEENSEEKQLTPLEQFVEVLKLPPTERFKEIFKTSERLFDDPELDTLTRNTILHNVLIQIRQYYPTVGPETRETLLKDAKAFFEKYRNNKEEEQERCEYALEMLLVLPSCAKLEQSLLNATPEEQRKLLLELVKILEPLELKQRGYAHQYVSGLLALNVMFAINRQLSDQTQRENIFPVMKTLSDVFASKKSETLKYYAVLLEQMTRRTQSQGQTCPWSDLSFTTISGESKKIADFRGKPLLLAFQANEGFWIDLLNNCAEHRKSNDLQILLITTKLPNETMKKFVEVCGVTFPVWNIPLVDLEKATGDSLPPHLAGPLPGAMLLDADGKVVNSYFGYGTLAAELGRFFGDAADDETLEELQGKHEKFVREILSRKLLNIPEDATVEQMHQRFQTALTYLLTPFMNSHSPTAIDVAWKMPELAQRIAEKTDDRKMIESMYDGLIFFAKNQQMISIKLPRFAEDVFEAAQKHQFPKIATEAKLIDFKIRFQTILGSRPKSPSENSGEFLKKVTDLRNELFGYVRKSKDDCSPASVIMIFRLINHGFSDKDYELEAETCLEMANILEEMNDPSVGKVIELFRGIANRLQLLGKEMPIEGETLDGKPFDPALYKGKVVLVDFWATWCGPCIAEVPNMKKAYEKYHEKGFEIVAISTDQDLDALKEYLEEKPLPWICLADELAVKSGKPSMSERYGVESIPTMLLIDRDGRVVLLEARDKALTDKLEELFAE